MSENDQRGAPQAAGLSTSEYEDREPIGLRESYVREGHRECPGCGRIMSFREGDEQGACNDCSGGAYAP